MDNTEIKLRGPSQSSSCPCRSDRVETGGRGSSGKSEVGGALGVGGAGVDREAVGGSAGKAGRRREGDRLRGA